MKTQSSRPRGTRGRLLALGLFAPICSVHAASGTWNSNGPGNWSDTTKWAGSVSASGATFTADFSTVDITGDHVVNLDVPVTIGTLQVGDLTTLTNSWVFSGTGPLTLDNGGAAPVLNIINRTPTISVPLAGTNGISKTGAGLVTLTGNNTITGTLTLQNVTGTNSAGVVLGNNTAIGGMTAIAINGTSTSGQYLSLSNGVTLPATVAITLNSPGGNNAPPGAIRSEGTGVNSINGPINVTLSNSRISNNSATRLDINGAITGNASNIVFRNAVNEGIHLTNTGNTGTGAYQHSGGSLWFDPGTIPATANLQMAISDAGTLQTNGTFTRALGIAAGQLRIGSGASGGRVMGFSARGGDLSINLGGSAAETFFNNFTAAANGTDNAINTNTLVLNNSQATGKLTLANPINLNGAARTLQVDTNVAELTGGVNGAVGLSKTGGGTLIISGASGWTGDLTLGAGDSNSVGIVRAAHSLAFGPNGSAKNITLTGLNRATAIIELDGGVTIDASKTLRTSGKSYVAAGGTAVGVMQSLRSVSGNNSWEGNFLINATGGGYGVESQAGTLTFGASPATTSVIRNDISGIRPVYFIGAGNFVLNSKVADNGAIDTGIYKTGTGNLSITRGDNDFDVVPNLFNGTTEIVSLTNTALPSSLGVASSINLGSTLRYTGIGESSDRVLGIFQSGATLDASGSGPFVLSTPSMSHLTGLASSPAIPFAAGVSTVTLNEASLIVPGQSITGTGIAANTTVTAVNPNTRVVTLSQPTSAATTTSPTLTFGGANNIDRTLTLTGTNTGNNSLAAPLSNPAGTGKFGVTKTGPGKWILKGPAQTYSGPTVVSQGTLGFDGAFPFSSELTVPSGTTLSLANVTLPVNENTGRALDIDGALSIDGPVSVALPGASPTGTFTVLEYGSITGAANLTSNYRGSSFSGGATSATMTVSTPGVALTWTGANGNFWDTKTTANWKNPANAPQTFFWADTVKFDDVGAAVAPFVELTGELRPASMTIDSSIDYTFQGFGTLAGPFPLTKTGTSTATINGNHTFTGGITINNGTIKPLTSQALGGNGNDIKVNSGGMLDTNGFMTASRDYDAIIAGSGIGGVGAIVNTGVDHQFGFGTLALSGNATIGGTGRWDVRPIVAGSGVVDLAGFTLTKTGTNFIGVIDSTLSNDGTINLTQGTLGITRTYLSGLGNINVTGGALLQFENNTVGSCSKPITLDGSSLRLQGSNYFLDSEVSITGTSTFDVEAARTLTLTNPVTGTGDLVKSVNTGTLTLTGANTYDGTTTIGAGALVIGSQGTLGTLGDGAVVDNGNLTINRPDTAYVVSNNISGTGTVTIGQGSGASFDSMVTLTGNNTFAGDVSVNSGGLKIFSPSALGTGTKNINLTNGTNGRPQFYLDGTGGNITVPNNINYRTSSTNTLQPAIGNLAGNNIVEGNVVLTSGGGSTAISTFGGTLEIKGGISADTSNRRVIFGGTGGAGIVSGVISNGSNPVGVDKVGTVTWTFTGSNSYSGTTAVTEGTLLINGNQSSAGGTVTVSTGATLGGTGTIGGTVDVLAGSTIAPGASIGTLSTVGPVTIAGTLAVELDATTSDRLTAGGSLALTGSTLQVTALGTPGQPAYVIASYGLLTGTFGTITGLPSGYTVNYNYNNLNQIAIVQSSNVYGSWETTNGIAGAGSSADSDSDGISNGIEFVIGGDPSGPSSDSSSLLPTATLDEQYVTFVFRRTDDSAAYNPFAEYGSALTGWTKAEGGVNGVIIAEDNNFFGAGVDRVRVQIPRTLAVGSKLFAHLRVDIP